MIWNNKAIYNRICRAVELLPVEDRKGAKVTLTSGCFNESIAVELRRYDAIIFSPDTVPFHPNIPLDWLLEQLAKPKFGQGSKFSMPKKIAEWWISWYTAIDWSRP